MLHSATGIFFREEMDDHALEHDHQKQAAAERAVQRHSPYIGFRRSQV